MPQQVGGLVLGMSPTISTGLSSKPWGGNASKWMHADSRSSNRLLSSKLTPGSHTNSATWAAPPPRRTPNPVALDEI